MLRVVRGQLSYSSPLDYGFLLIYLIEKFSFNCSRGGEKKSVSWGGLNINFLYVWSYILVSNNSSRVNLQKGARKCKKFISFSLRFSNDWHYFFALYRTSILQHNFIILKPYNLRLPKMFNTNLRIFPVVNSSKQRFKHVESIRHSFLIERDYLVNPTEL